MEYLFAPHESRRAAVADISTVSLDRSTSQLFNLFEGGEASLADPTRGYLRLGKAMWDRLWLKGATGIVLFVD